MATIKYTEEKEVVIRRGRVDSVDLYEVKESELELLENGEPTGIQLNFAIFLLSIAFSAILTLCSATFKSGLIQNIFLFTSIIGVLGGIYMLILWYRGRGQIKSIIQTIKNRIPPDILRQSTEIVSAEVTRIPPSNDLNAPEG